ncbi:Adenylate kinase 8 [Takifugu flavidus]|uniref:Adenylate kinase 8 n=1 Tax=Takifugu flavidus TaxID=433684 RepID=A0A5C6N0Y4_9TELE|nr:Adenylate kinase 8 [Takifugu flavidus]
MTYSIGLFLQPDGSPHLWYPQSGTGITATTSTRGLAAATCDSCLDNGGAEHGPFRLNVHYRPRNTIKALTSLTGSSTKRSQQTLTKCLGLPGPCGGPPPDPTHQVQGSNPFAQLREPQRQTRESRGKQKAHPSSPSLTLSNSSVKEFSTPLKDLSSQANAIWGGGGSTGDGSVHVAGSGWAWPPGARDRAPAPGLAPGWGPILLGHVFQGWLLEGFPQTRLQALCLQEAGIIPEHVVVLEAPDDVLLQRSRGKMVDPLTGEVYHQTFLWPDDHTVAQRLRHEGLSDKQHVAELQRYRCEGQGLMSIYQHVLRVINGDQPHSDVYQQALAFIQTRRYTRTPRILLLGPPGSGKSHQAKLLSEKHKLVDVPDLLVLQVLENRLSQLDCSSRGWIIHGFPRNLDQARLLHKSQYQPNRVYFLDLNDDVCLNRISLRATDPISGQRFHAVTRPALSPEVQNRLRTRPKDTTPVMIRKLKLYRLDCVGLQSLYPEAVHIDADLDPQSVFDLLDSRLTAD